MCIIDYLCVHYPYFTHHFDRTPDWVCNSRKNEAELGTGFEARGLGLLISSDRHAEVAFSQHRILNKRKVCRDLQSRWNNGSSAAVPHDPFESGDLADENEPAKNE